MSKLSSNGKLKREKKGGGAASRTIAIVGWIESSVKKRVGIFRSRTSEMVAALCSKAVGFEVPVNKMARELDRAGVSFLRTPADPPKQGFSKTEYLRAHQGVLEERLERIEKKLFGETFGKKLLQ
jgi:hypothetical protein